MPSQLSKSIATRMLVAKAQGAFDQEYSSALELLRIEVDAELAEVREVLEGIITCVFDEGQGPILHWCDPEDTCNKACQRARALYERLEIK